MKNSLPPHRFPRSAIWFAMVIATLAACRVSHADQRVILKSGIALQGLLAEIASLNKNPFQEGGQGQVKTRPILLVDDGLRRVYVHRRGMVAIPPQDVRGVEQTIEFKQKTPLGGDTIQLIGEILGVSEFNQYGRRTIRIRGPKGAVINITQGITELNARYAKVEALTAKPSYIWDMRVATRSIMPKTLQSIFRQRIDQTDFDQRLMVVRFFIESERFRAAEEELTRTIRAFPEQQNMDAQLIGIIQRQASQLISEAARRAEVGQEQYARDVYKRFPMDIVGRTTREEVKIAAEALDETDQQVKVIVQSLRADLDQLPEDQRKSLQTIFAEIESGLSSATLRRLSDYSRLRQAKNVVLEDRVALAIAGWLMGAGSGEQNLIVATSLVNVRDLVAEYLGSADLVRRPKILEELRTMEGSQIQYVAKLLPLLKPVKAWPQGSADANIPGFYRIGRLAGENASQQIVNDPDYLIQLPPEYDPLREYPCLVVLAPPGVSPESELTWWAGEFDASQKSRVGHAMRNGYIVISPAWGRKTQRVYEYTPREHHAVLSSMRHAMRRASIDSDRVFIAGHGDGATAAWDIALSHPDHWAGMISINGEPSKTIKHYSPNARHVPLYFVLGEASGPARPPLIRMGSVFDDHLHVRNDATLVMYRGRGREDFYEEIPELFKWLNVSMHVRHPIPKEISTVTMRTGDQYFWWLELGALKPTVDLNPVLWDQARRIKAGKVEAWIGGGNQIRIAQIPSETFTLWLRPDIGLDLSQQVIVRRGSTPTRFTFDGELETLLEDTRQRADRKRPFWAKIRIPE